ncbi:MAG: MarR family transcriptional regulator [Desulfosarcinaceae bacterium]|jgi:DNA-binding MarR family transcriptional regulator
MTSSSQVNCIFYQLSRARRKALRYWKQRLADTDVTAIQAMVLLFLFEEDMITSAELGSRTWLDSATLAGVLDRLQKAGLVERRRHPADRRSIQVCLTGTGRQLAERLARIREQANAEFLDCLTAEEEMILRALLKKLAL